MPETRAARAFLLALVLLVLAATVGTWLDLRRRGEALTEQVATYARAQERLERAVQLFRFERGSKGLGVSALVEQLRFWAPLLDVSTTPQREIPMIQQRVDDILTALDDIGSDAFETLHREFLTARPGKDDELMRWLLQSMSRVDAARGKDLLAACARGIDPVVSGRTRMMAADRLVEVDKERAARLLAEILTYETAAGIDGSRVTPELQAQLAAAKAPPQPMRMFSNFVDLLVRAGGPDVEERLLLAATRPAQDRMTVQTCVKYLGDLKSKRAVKALKKLYDTPPEMVINPIFQNHCLEAIGKIEGAAACDFFRELLRGKPDEVVQAKLQDLIKTYCP